MAPNLSRECEVTKPRPGCSQLTSSGLSNLIQLRQLEELELTNCPGSSRELVLYLRSVILSSNNLPKPT